MIVTHTPMESQSIYHSDLFLGMRLSCSKNSKYFGLRKEMLLTQIKAQHDPWLGQGSIQISQTGGENCIFKEQTARIVRLGSELLLARKEAVLSLWTFFADLRNSLSSTRIFVNIVFFSRIMIIETFLDSFLACLWQFWQVGVKSRLCILHLVFSPRVFVFCIFPCIFLHSAFFLPGDLVAPNSAASPPWHHEHRRCQQGKVKKNMEIFNGIWYGGGGGLACH